MTRRAKIVCTMGPATSSEEGIAALLDAGMNVARMNFSHGDYADHQVIYDRLRAAAEASGKALAILADLQGPKIRLGRFADGPHDWNTGDQVTITVDDVVGTRDRVSTTYKGLAQRRPARRPAADRRRQGRSGRHRGRRQRRALHGHRGRPGVQQQGHLAARDERLRPGDVREGHRRPEIRAVPRRRRRRAVLRPVAHRRRHSSTR